MKKIISLTVAIIVAFSFLAFPFVISADDESEMTNQEYYAAQSYLIAKYKDGKISYSEFQQQSQAVTDEFVSKNTVGGVLQSGALNASNNFNAVSQKIGDTVQKYGDSARDYISSFVSGFLNSYTVSNNKPTTDLKDSVAMVKIKNKDGSCYIYYGNTNGELYYNISSTTSIYLKTYRDEFYGRDGSLIYSHNANSSISCEYGTRSDVTIYGSWKWRESGLQAETDDEFQTITDYDFSEAPERELEDLLKKILNEFELQQPDLSSIEGLLNAIYARLGTLDSDNDNELLASLNAAVLALVESNNGNNEALLNELLKFREDLKNGTVGSDSSAHGHEISGTLYNVIPLDKNWLNKIFHDKENLKVQYEGKTYYLEDCGCLKLDDKYYTPNMNYDSYAISDYDFSNDDIIIDNSKYVDVDFKNYTALFAGFSAGQKKKVNNIIDLVTKFVEQAVPYSAIKGALIPFETIIFNSEKPEDIYFIYRSQPYNASAIDFKAPILSSSFFENPYVSNAMLIVRPFLTIVIGYSWLKVMRKKAVSMLG